MDVDRREFLTLVGCSALALSAGALLGAKPTLSWAATTDDLGRATNLDTLYAAVERIVPHADPELKELARQTARAIAMRAQSDPALRQTVEQVVGELDERAQKTYNRPFAKLIAEQQIIIMEQIQSSRAFQHLVNQVLADYYDKPQVWHALGYPGPVNDHEHMEGGYLARGYDKLDW